MAKMRALRIKEVFKFSGDHNWDNDNHYHYFLLFNFHAILNSCVKKLLVLEIDFDECDVVLIKK